MNAALNELLICAAEEGAEVTQAVGKYLRFGRDSTPPAGGAPNNEYLAQEIGDVLAVAELLCANPDSGITWDMIDAGRQRKHEKIKDFLFFQNESSAT